MGDGDQQTIQLSGWGKGVKLTGTSAFLACLVVVLLALLGYVLNFNLNSWGEPVPIGKALQHSMDKLDDHTVKMSVQHDEITMALRWNTYVQWACSSNNISAKAKEKCTNIDLLKPEAEQPSNPTRRRYRLPDSE